MPATLSQETSPDSMREMSLESSLADSVSQKQEDRRQVRISRQELASMTTQLAIMTRSGVDVVSALKSIARQTKRPRLRMVLTDVYENILGGNSFSASLSMYKASFGSSYVAAVAAGEVAGQLGEVMSQLARSIREEIRLRGSLRSILVYPITLLAVATFVIAGLILFVLPKFADVFGQFGTELPRLTSVVLSIGKSLNATVLLWGTVAVACLIGVIWFFRSDAGRKFWDRTILMRPLFRRVARPLYIGRACRMLGMMLTSGVTLLDSIRLTRAGMSSPLYDEVFDVMEEEVLNGRGMSPVLWEFPFIPESAAEMLGTAEKTGTLADVTKLLAEHYEEEAEAKLKEIIATLEPVVTIGLGIVVSAIVLSVMVPMFDLATLAGGSG